ncbi:centrosomal protein of 70 kDa isoform X2 [Mugil cephalus]|uniref:centrosomal protein of 70 kDa isoform X2 n=1 Tax=Mugil cephalus TaxID=48193 RepID=UPI001FB74492|nr:centrosomal protein of 70 kDa isoform X2 [Mugil cephalus]
MWSVRLFFSRLNMNTETPRFFQSRNRTYVYLWTYGLFKQEQAEWEDVNKLLQHHGFKPVFFADPVENENLSNLVLLDKKSAVEVRTTLRTMLTDSERRQSLIQELVKSNNQLKGEIQEHMSRAAHQSNRVVELEGLLDEVKTRVQDLEDRCLGKAVHQNGHVQQLEQEKKEAQKHCQVLEQQLSKWKAEAAELQKKLYFAVKEEEQRAARQSQTFQIICKKASQPSSPADREVLDVIDFYDTKMSQLLDELRSAKGESEGSKASDRTRTKKTSNSVTSYFKTILKEQQKESRAEVEELKNEVESLKQELEKRPTLKEVKFYKHKLRRLEGLNKHSNARLPKEDYATENSKNTGDRGREASLCARYRHLLTEINVVVSNTNAPLRLHRQKPSAVALEPTDFQTLLPALEAWAQQLRLLKDLQRSLNVLSARLMPWQPPGGDCNFGEAVKVEDIMLLVDTMLENTATDDEKSLRSPTRYTLGSMVSHFQKLFDVASLSGVYPRMNEVYTRLGEMTNAMRNLRDVLDLDNRVSPAEVVNHVARLVSSTQHTAGFHNLLGDADIDSIITKMKQHEEFFPTFHALITEILQTLGVSHLDDILPALRSLTSRAQSPVSIPL